MGGLHFTHFKIADKLMLSAYIKDNSGATAIEYALIAALIALSIIGGASAVSTSLNGMFDNVSEALD